MTDAIDFEAIPDLDAPIEPWTPKVGDRVRVTASAAECRTAQDDHDSDTLELLGTVTTGHWESEIGRTGRIVPLLTGQPEAVDGHDYCVKYDDPIPVGRGDYCFTCTYAAWELEPLP